MKANAAENQSQISPRNHVNFIEGGGRGDYYYFPKTNSLYSRGAEKHLFFRTPMLIFALASQTPSPDFQKRHARVGNCAFALRRILARRLCAARPLWHPCGTPLKEKQARLLTSHAF